MKIVKTAYSGYARIRTLLANLVSSMLTLTETGGTITTDGTVQMLFVHDAPAGVYSPKMLSLDFTNQSAGTTVKIDLFYRIKSGGDYRHVDSVTFADGQSPDLKLISLADNRFGVSLSIEKTAGANADYDFEVFYAI